MKSRCVSYHELDRIEAEEGSTGLRIAIEKLFRSFSRKHGIPLSLAMNLQLQGYRP